MFSEFSVWILLVCTKKKFGFSQQNNQTSAGRTRSCSLGGQVHRAHCSLLSFTLPQSWPTSVAFFFFWAETAAWTDSRWARRKDDSPSYRLFHGEQQGVDVFKSLKFWLVYPLDDVPEEKEEGEDGKNEKVLLRYKPRNTKTSVVTLNQGLWGDSCSPRFFQGADTKDAFRSAPMPTDI